MSLSATLFGRDSAIFKATNILGLGIPGWLDKKFGAKDTEGPRLSDLSVQTSTYGAPVPRYYGMCAGAGNVMYLEHGKLKEKVHKKKSGGKGGSSSEPTRTYTYSATFHLALCEGPIVGVRRIWCGDVLIYNSGSDDLNSIIASNQAAKGWRLYLGTDDQMPDPRYEAEYGVGNVSAHRGLAYIAFYDFQLEKYSNTLQAAQFKVEIVTKLGGSSNRTLLDKLMITGGDGYNISGSIPDYDGSGAFAANGSTTNLATYSCSTSGSVRLVKPYGAQTLYTTASLQGCDDQDFAIWKGSVVTGEPFITVGGQVYFGAINQVYGYLVKSDGTFYYFEHDSTVARVGSKALGMHQEFTIAASRYHVVFGGVVYGLSPSMTTLYAWDADDFSLISTVAISDPSLLGFSFRSGRYCDGLNMYITTSAATIERVVQINLLTGIASVFMDAPIWPGTSSRGAIRISGDIYYRLYYGSVSFEYSGTAVFRVFQRNNYTTANEFLSVIIESELKSSGLLTDDDFDTSLITSTVRGYRVAGGSIREALEPLQTAFPFDVVQSGYKIKFIPRGQDSVATIPWEDLGATDDGDPDEIFKQSREMDSQLPAKTTVTYLDGAREYNINEQYSERINTQAVNVEKIELPIVLTADEAAGIAEFQEFLPWLQRTNQEFKLPPKYLHLEAADVVTVIGKDAVYNLLLTDVAYTQDGRLECKSVPDSASIYTPNASGGEGVEPDGTIGLLGPATFIPLDIPVVDETAQNSPGFVGVMAGEDSTWSGGTAFRTPDDGQTWSDIQGYTGAATLGVAVNALSANPGTLIDQAVLGVSMQSGELESITRDQMLSGLHYAAYGVDGRWEIVRYQNAVLQADSTYLVSGFIRGDKGTEWATGLHQAGDYFVILDDPDNAFIGMAGELIGTSLTYRGITAGRDITTGTDVPFTYRGVNLECLSPVYGTGTRSSGDLIATWVRRSRLSGNWWVTGVPTTVGEATEAYEVDVMSGSTVKRTITSTTPTITYTSAQQVTDFGSAQSSITLRIYQLSAVVGRGYPLEVTL